MEVEEVQRLLRELGEDQRLLRRPWETVGTMEGEELPEGLAEVMVPRLSIHPSFTFRLSPFPQSRPDRSARRN